MCCVSFFISIFRDPSVSLTTCLFLPRLACTCLLLYPYVSLLILIPVVCSMSKQPSYKRSERVMYYRVGIGGKSGEPVKQSNGWLLYSLSSLRALLNHTQVSVMISSCVLVKHTNVRFSAFSFSSARLQNLQFLHSLLSAQPHPCKRYYFILCSGQTHQK